ncbi:MAG: hypothetical protein JO326_12120 [Acetobacteraceae bacterium]|nr:hypothetical protein [Acetobacteraceae bacterium]
MKPRPFLSPRVLLAVVALTVSAPALAQPFLIPLSKQPQANPPPPPPPSPVPVSPPQAAATLPPGTAATSDAVPQPATSAPRSP